MRADTWIPGDDSTFLFLRPEELTTTTLAKLQRVYLSRTWLTFVVDEAHCALNWGDSFREDYGQLKRKLALFKEAPKMALTATASPTTVEKIIGYLGLVDPEVVIEPASKQHIYLTVQPLETKMQVLEGLLEELKKDRGRSVKTVVFIRERTEVSNVWAFFHHYLPANISHRCEMYMSTTADRMKRGIAEYFKDQDSSIRLLIATSAFGLGVDCQGIRRVVHLEPPTSFDDFVQQIGRAGRNGEQVASILVNDGVQKGKDEQMRNSCQRRAAEGLSSASTTVSSKLLAVIPAATTSLLQWPSIDFFLNKHGVGRKERKERKTDNREKQRHQQAMKHQCSDLKAANSDTLYR